MLAKVCIATLLLTGAWFLTGCAHKPLSTFSPPAVLADRGADQEDATRWFLERRAGEGATELPADVYVRARDHVARMPRYSVAGGAVDVGAAATAHTWTSVG